MMEERRQGRIERRRGDRRRRTERRQASPGGPMSDRRTRFSIIYFIGAFAVLLALNYMLSRQNTRQPAYSDLKQRIAAGQIRDVVLSEDMIRALPADSLKARGAPDSYTAVRVPNDNELIPLLDARHVTYTGTTQGWLGQMITW